MRNTRASPATRWARLGLANQAGEGEAKPNRPKMSREDWGGMPNSIPRMAIA
jgi:hypothetical protein